MKPRHLSSACLAFMLAACALPTATTPQRLLGAIRPGEVVVRWREGVMAPAQDALLARVGATRADGEGLSRQLLHVPAGSELVVVQQLAASAEVALAEPDYVKRSSEIKGSFRPYVAPQRALALAPNDPYWSQGGKPYLSPVTTQSALWGLRALKADAAWDTTAGSPSVLVATIDTGADMSHPDLVANLDRANALNLVEPGTPVDDDFGHGTHVAGIIAAVGNNGAGVIGVAWRTRVMPIRVLGVDGTGSSYDTVSAIAYAVKHGARVINMSLGSPDFSQDEADAIAAAIKAGVTVVAASGNEATDGNYEEYPASYAGVVGVAAVGPDLKRALFSNYNSHVAVAAPGVDILSTIPSRMSPTPYGYLSGTSMATPMVAGVAALILAAHPSWTQAQVVRQLITTTQHLAPDADTSTGPNVYFGAGLVNAQAAVTQ